LAAFDAALRCAGVANYNLIRLSSVIPPYSTVTATSSPLSSPGRWGDRLYASVAEAFADVPGAEAWAGVGWVQDDETGQGLLAEHEGRAETEVRSAIEATLGALRRGRGSVGERLGDVHMVTHGVVCTGDPVCALVLAAFTTEAWGSVPSSSTAAVVTTTPPATGPPTPVGFASTSG
jgi:arginine decarboxylase